MTSNKKFTFDCLEIAKNFSFFIFCAHGKHWSIVNKAQFNPQSLRENQTNGYRAENIDFFHRGKRQESSTFVYIDFYTLLIMYCYVEQC